MESEILPKGCWCYECIVKTSVDHLRKRGIMTFIGYATLNKATKGQ
jgi:hypothetical protein